MEESKNEAEGNREIGGEEGEKEEEARGGKIFIARQSGMNQIEERKRG